MNSRYSLQFCISTKYTSVVRMPARLHRTMHRTSCSRRCFSSFWSNSGSLTTSHQPMPIVGRCSHACVCCDIIHRKPLIPVRLSRPLLQHSRATQELRAIHPLQPHIVDEQRVTSENSNRKKATEHKHTNDAPPLLPARSDRLAPPPFPRYDRTVTI